MATVKVVDSDSATLTNPTTGQTGITAHQYPLSVQGEPDLHSSYLVFYAVEPTAGGLSNDALDRRNKDAMRGAFKEQTKAVIQLYMPTIVENTQHDYGETDGGFMQDFMMNFQRRSGSSKLLDAAKAAVDTGVATVNYNANKVSQKYNAQVSGQVLGSRSATMYNGTQVRQQNFLYQFRPRNLSELKEVGRIINTFQVNSASTLGGRATFDSLFGTNLGGYAAMGTSHRAMKVPPLWFVEERVNRQIVPKLRFTPKFTFGPAAITNLRINKAPDQTYDTFRGTAGDPIAIDLEITLTELRPMFADYYAALGEGLGKPDSGEMFFGSFKQDPDP